MSLPALRLVRARFPKARITVLAKPWVADLYAREAFADAVVPYRAAPGWRDLGEKWQAAAEVRKLGCDAALLLPNSFESAAIAWLAGIPARFGYNRDGRGLLLTRAVPRPVPGSLPPHESFYYCELLRQLGWIDRLPSDNLIRLDGAGAAAVAGATRFQADGLTGPVVGVSPGAAYGTAKRWLPERFAAAAAQVAGELGGAVALFGSGSEKALCDGIAQSIAAAGVAARNYAGATTLAEFIERAAACRAYLTNDSGAMHIASALGVPTVAVFGATDHTGTGPTGAHARVVRKPVDCAPCLLRECPIDHRCMTAVTASEVAETALELLK